MKVCDWREGWTARSFHSRAALRVLAFGQNLRRLRFTAFRRRLSNPLRGFEPLPYEKSGAHEGLHFFQGERGIRTLGPVTVSGFRDRPNRPLWHLSKVRII